MESFSLPVSLLRKTIFCPRIPFYCEVAQINPSRPSWVQQGVDYHTRIERLMKRRTLEHFDIQNPLPRYQCPLSSEKWRLHGIADMILEGDNQIIPIEFKARMDVLRKGTIAQLMAYGLLASEHFKKEFRRAVIIVGLKNSVTSFENNNENQKIFLTTHERLFQIVEQSELPDSSATEHQCGQCEYFKFCNDRF
jgi:CRISPR-associated exonuclease Cas4